MLYIKIKGVHVDLPEDFAIDLILENPLLQQDRIPVPYTTSFEFPLTIANKSLFANPTRINNADRIWEYDAGELGYGAHVFYYGMLIIAEISGKLMANFQASDNLADFKKPMNQLDLGIYDFAETDYDGRKQKTGSDITALLQYQFFVSRLHLEDFPITAAPIKILGDPPSLSTGGTPIYNYMLWAQNNFFNAFRGVGGNNDGFTDPSDGLYKSGVLPVYPQIRIAELMRILLKLSDENNPFINSELYKMVITSHFHRNFKDDLIVNWFGFIFDNDYPSPMDPPEPLYFNMGSYQSQSSAAEVIKAVLNILCMTIFSFYEEGIQVYRLKFNKDLIADESFDDWDKLVGTIPKLSRETRQDYSFGYSDFNETEPKVDSDFILSTIEDLLAAPVNSETNEQLYYIQTTGQHILKKENEFNPDYPFGTHSYEVRSSGLGGSNRNGGYDISSQFSPLKMTITENLLDISKSDEKHYYPLYLPIYSGEISVDFKPAIMLYQGLQPFENDLGNIEGFPHLSYHNYNASGERLGDLSLAWGGNDGLIKNYHEHFKNWVERDKLMAYVELIFPPYLIKSIDMSKKKMIRNRLFWIRKMVIPMSRKKIEPARVDLVEAPLPPVVVPGGSASSGGGGIPASGTCYTITIDTTIFNPETDGFNITRRLPGASQSTAFYTTYSSTTAPNQITIPICSEIEPFYTQSGVVVESVPGVSRTTGGSCSIDGECAP
jgi:hypothetical protein